MNEFFPVPGCCVEHVTRISPTSIQISAQGARHEAICPDCGTASQAVHSRYQRHPADLPSLGGQVRLLLSVRRFYCRNPACARLTFAETIPDLLAPKARRTRRLAATQGRIGIACGGETGARLMRLLGMPVSADTVLRLVRAVPLPVRAPPRVLGLDDWARRKGQTYGTILVDLEEHHVVDLLPDRTAQTLAAWLREHDTVSVIARDRSTEYARGASLGAPGATQVVDRWHLLRNLREMIERWLAGIHGRLRQLPPVHTGELSPRQRRGTFSRTRSETARTQDSRARRLARYEEVHRRLQAGGTILAISRAMGISRQTVRSFASAQSFPERAERRSVASALDPWLDHVESRLAEGCATVAELWRDIRERGYPGSVQQLHRWVDRRREVPAPSGRPSERKRILASARQLAWLLVRSPDALDETGKATLAWIAQDAEVARLSPLIARFGDLVRACGVTRGTNLEDAPAILERWLDEAECCGTLVIETFAAGLRQDQTAIQAALTLPWSSGQAEGQINKLKLIKRQMYGRGNFDLIRRRVLLAA
ncbi:ISL3 family transposase [Skermanella rosea]|uniref:ISL3 family transposase n=1 Tax=Skermanella rosea TaxID=1817965 RepID=UPI00389AF035